MSLRPARPVPRGAYSPGFDLVLLAPPAIHIIRNFELPCQLVHRATRFLREPDGLGLERIGKLTSRCCCLGGLHFIILPPREVSVKSGEGQSRVDSLTVLEPEGVITCKL